MAVPGTGVASEGTKVPKPRRGPSREAQHIECTGAATRRRAASQVRMRHPSFDSRLLIDLPVLIPS